MVRGPFLLLLSCLLLAIPGLAQTGSPALLGEEIEVSGINSRSTLNRFNGLVETSFELHLRNSGRQTVEPPLQVAIRFSGDVNPATTGVRAALGGIGEDPHGTFYLDLSNLIGSGLPPGAEIMQPVTYYRASDRVISYTLEAYGIVNQAPEATSIPDFTGLVGEALTFSGIEIFDPEGDPINYEWNFGDGGMSAEAEPTHVFTLPGIHEVVLRLRDDGGALKTLELIVQVLPGGDVAAARTRTLDDAGLPLGGVVITEWLNTEPPRSYQSDEASGFASLGLGSGPHTWKFSKPGYLTVWRGADLESGRVTVVPNPWLIPLNAETVELSILGQTDFVDPSATVQVSFPAGSFEQTGTGALISLDPQTLPYPLPRGWSPLAAFHLQTDHEPVQPGAFSARLAESVSTAETLVMARFDEESLAWVADIILPGNGGDSLDGPIAESGSYAILVPDSQPGPPAAVASEPLPAALAAEPDYATVSAVGEVSPPSVVASTDPKAVTVEGTLAINPGSVVSSGFWLPTRIDEIYTLTDGRDVRTPDYDTTVYAYARPSGETGACQAAFAMRPQLLFGPADLEEARVRADVFAPENYEGVLLDSTGGVLARNGVRILAPGGVLAGLTAAEILDARLESFLTVAGDYPPVKAFQLNLTGINPGNALQISFQPLAANTHYVLARLIIGGGEFGLEPVLRMASGEDGIPVSIEPAEGPRLPGLDKPGQYVLLQLPAPLGLVEGTVTDAEGRPAENVSVRVDESPFSTVTNAEGRYRLLSPAGPVSLIAYNPTTEQEGTAQGTLANTDDGLFLDFTATPSGPRVVAIRPSESATGVPTVDPVVVTFSKGVNPATFGPAALSLVAEGETKAVPGTLGLNLTGTEATFLPTNPLQSGTAHRVLLANTIQDTAGRPIEGDLAFSFTTEEPRVRSAGAQLVIYEPGAQSVPPEILDQLVGYEAGEGSTHVIAHGSAGTADPEVPVILVNEFTGETATVLSNPDGSFASFINAAEEDFISAVFINANDTRITVPATKQLFDDGRQGLYRYGGILEAESDGGPVQVLIEPESIEERVTFELKGLDLEQVLATLQTPEISGGQPLAAVSVAHDPNEEVTAAADIAFPINRDSLQLPEGIDRPEDATFILTRAVETQDGTVVYEIIDDMVLEGDRLVTKSPPYAGLLFKKVFKKLLKTSSSSFKKLNTSNKILDALGLPGIQETITHQLLLPFMITIGGVTTDIIGQVEAVEVDENGEPTSDPVSILGATVAWSQPPYPPPGQFQSGTFVASSREPNGFFIMKADITLHGLGYRLRATHPRFPNQVAVATNQIGDLSQRLLNFDVYRTDLQFQIPPPSADEPGADTTAPTVGVAHNPYLPQAGLGTGESGTTLFIVTRDDRQIQEVVVNVLEARDTDGILMPLDAAPLTFIQTLEESPQRQEDEYFLEFEFPGRVLVEIRATDTTGNLNVFVHTIDFDRVPPVPPIPGSDDTTGPRIHTAWPHPGTENLAPFPEIWLTFSEPIPEDFFMTENLDWITFQTDHQISSLIPSEDLSEVRIRYFGAPSGEVTLSVGTPLSDAAGNPFDQDPGTDGEQSYQMTFNLADAVGQDLDLSRGGGVVGDGTILYALERDPTAGTGLVCYDVADPTAPLRLATMGLPDRPSDLVYIPDYPLQASLTAPPVVRDLVVIIGGNNGGGAPGQAVASFKWMWVVDVTDSSAPFRLASGIISQNPTSLVTKIEAAPPLVAYQEMAAEVTSIHLVDLPAFVIGRNATPEEIALFPDQHTPGVDLNGDGDFADVGESVSLPPRSPAKFFGEFFSYAPLSARERMVDFTISEDGDFFAITRNLDTGECRFFNVLATIGSLDETAGALFFPGIDAKRVFTLKNVPFVLAEQARIIDMALLSVRSGAPTGSAVYLINITDPENPEYLGYMPLESTDGIPQTIKLRSDGLLSMALSNDILIVDPRKILEVDSDGRSIAIVDRVTGAGSGARSYVSDSDGLHALALGGRSEVFFNGPKFEIVTFNQSPVAAQAIASLPDADKRNLLGEAVRVDRLLQAFIEFEEQPDPTGNNPPTLVPSDPLPQDHYYILTHIPGSATGDEDPFLPLLLASVNLNGELPPPGDGTFLSGMLVDPETLQTIEDLKEDMLDPNQQDPNQSDPPEVYPASINAYRLSQDTNSPCYNLLLAGPFTLHRSLSVEEAEALSNQLPRKFLKTNKRVVVSLPPFTGAAFLDDFRSRLEGLDIFIGTNQVWRTDYLRNPLIFIPGVMASEMNDGSFSDLWVPLLNTALSSILPFFQPLEDLILEDSDSTSVFPTEVLRKIELLSFELDVQGSFLDYLRDDLRYGEYTWDYKDPNINQKALKLASENGVPDWDSLAQKPKLFPFPYDWRKDNAQNAEALRKYVDLILEAHPDAEQVDIVAHSMGGLVGRRFIIDNPDLVENFITIASPFLGAAKAVGTMKTGDLDEFALNFLVPSDISIRISRNMPALHQLMPNKGMFDLGFYPVVESGWDLDGNGQYFDKLDYDQYKNALDGPLYRDYQPDYAPPEPKPIETNAEPFHATEQYDWSRDDPDVNYYHIVAVQQKPATIGRLEAYPKIARGEKKPNVGLSFPPVRFIDSEQNDRSLPIIDPNVDLDILPGNYYLTYSLRPRRTAGDGTVPFLSATRGYGAGNGKDLNAPNAVMAAIVSESTSFKDDKAVSHVDVLQHPKLHALLERILLNGLSKSELPILSIEAANPVEGTPMEFSVNPSGNIPKGNPVYVWETGDGRTLNKASGKHTYSESGVYMLSCAVYWPEEGVGTVTSKEITVSNAAPTISLEVDPPQARPGESIVFQVDRSDTGIGDEHTYLWEFDGVVDETIPSSAFRVERAYELEGTYSVRVTVEDDEGLSASVQQSVIVDTSTGLTSLAMAPTAPAATNHPSEAEPLEYVEVLISGHETSEFTTEVESDGSLLTNLFNKVLKDFRGVFQEIVRDGEEILTIHRVSPNGGAPPASVTITAEAVDPVVGFRVRHVKEDNSIRTFIWEVDASSAQEIELTLDWEQMPAATENAILSWTDPAATVARIVSDFEADEPTAIFSTNSHSDVTEIISFDRKEYNSSDATAELMALVDTTLDDDPATAFDETTTLENAKVTIFEENKQPLEELPSRAVAGILFDSRLEETITTTPVQESNKTPVITDTEAEEVRNAVRQAFANAEADIKKWIIAMDDIWVFEQGTGASLWKGNLAKSRYKKGVSDNDYELFMPVFKQPVGITANDPGDPINIFVNSQQEEFARVAHTPTYMQGDWYFKYPIGVDKDGRQMDNIPDFEDELEYETYLATVETWRYYLPFGIGATELGAWPSLDNKHYIDVPATTPIGGELLFKNPLTPAQIIAAILTDKVTNDEALRKILTDISFFPFRREHFMFGIPSVELPPPFGDDPLGDAGMGRGFLFLKWALEGVFLPGNNFIFNNNLPRPDNELRTLVHNRLERRQDVLGKEAYEWGSYQEFAMLLESAHLRMREQAANATFKPEILPDYIKKHDEKIMKKTGKAVIRSVLAEMMADDQARASVLETTPAEFDQGPDYLSFEDFIGIAAEGNQSSVSLGAQEVQDYLGAKLADTATYNRIRQSAGGVTSFISSGFDYLKNSVQIPNGQTYTSYLDGLLTEGLIYEKLVRTSNARAVDHGIETLTGTELPGRADLFGIEDDVQAKYSFVVSLQKRGYDPGESAGPITVTLKNTEGSDLVWEDITIPSTDDSISLGKRNNADKYPFFTVFRSIQNPTPPVQTHTFSLSGAGMDGDSIESDNEVTFESEFLSVSGHFLADFNEVPAGERTRWVCRSVALTVAEYQDMISNELSKFELHSAAVRNGRDVNQRIEAEANRTRTRASRLPPGTEYQGFTFEDMNLMTSEQLAAISHVGGPPPNSPGLSTAEKIFFPFGWVSSTVDKKAYMIIMEVPIEQGIEYLPISNGGVKRINALEGHEVVYMGRIRFNRAYVFEIGDADFNDIRASNDLIFKGAYIKEE